jgi:hypothetical protein
MSGQIRVRPKTGAPRTVPDRWTFANGPPRRTRRWMKCRLAMVSTAPRQGLRLWPPSTRKQPGVLETGALLAKRAGLPYLLREASRHPPDFAESREFESRRIGFGRSLKARIAPHENDAMRKSPHSRIIPENGR